jgi:hypothetical protein
VRSAPAFALSFLAAAALGACGGDDDETTGTAETSPTTTSTTGAVGTERCTEAESPPNIVNVISHGTDCGAVAEAMAEIRSVSREFRIGDFQCTRVEGARLSGTWECRGEANYFTFEFGD